MPRFDHFDLLAPIYGHAVPVRQSEMMVELAELPTAGSLLDVGGGTGRVSKALVGMASKIVIADLSLGMLRQAAGKNGLQRVCSASEALPFPPQSFARIIMVDALHHVFSQEETARHLWRLLAPGGRIVIEEPDVRTFAVKLVALAEKLALMRSHFLTPSKIASLFPYSNASLKIVQSGWNVWVIVAKNDA